MTKLFFLALAGACGTLARFGLSELVKQRFDGIMPWSTWSVNIIGCFFFGLVWVLAEERGILSTDVRFVTLVGFMGAFTTFSAYIFDCSELLRDGYTTALITNIMGQNIVGFTALIAGMGLGRYLGKII